MARVRQVASPLAARCRPRPAPAVPLRSRPAARARHGASLRAAQLALLLRPRLTARDRQVASPLAAMWRPRPALLACLAIGVILWVLATGLVVLLRIVQIPLAVRICVVVRRILAIVRLP